MLWVILAQVPIPNTSGELDWLNASATALVGGLLVWIITKAFPSMMDRHDKIQEATIARFEKLNQTNIDHFERVINGIDGTRAIAAKEGHDAAKMLSQSIANNTECIKDNTRAVQDLSSTVNRITGKQVS